MASSQPRPSVTPDQINSLRASIVQKRQEMLRQVSQTRKDERLLNRQYGKPEPAKFLNTDIEKPVAKRQRKK